MEKAVIHVFKEFINKSNIEGFKAYLTELEEEDDGSTPWDYFFQKVYLHACLKKCMPIVDLMTAKYNELDPITQIAIRQVFPYGRHLLSLKTRVH
jgi:hypothetical protein